jgi:hypothetical protein
VDVSKGRLDPQPGIDTIIQELRAKRLPERIRATISLPSETGAPGPGTEAVSNLIGTYCRSNIRRNELEIAAIRREGLMELGPAILLLVATTLVSLFVAKTKPFSEETDQLLIAGLGILSWVGMWRPLGALLYDWWEPYRDNRIYRRLINMDLTVLSGSATVGQ